MCSRFYDSNTAKFHAYDFFSAMICAEQEDGLTSMKGVSEFLDRSAKMLFMTEIMRGFWLTAEVMTKPKVGGFSSRFPSVFIQFFHTWMVRHFFSVPTAGDHQLPIRERPFKPSLSWRACAAPVPERRGALHRVQALRSDLPCAGRQDAFC